MKLIFDGAFGTYYYSLYDDRENCELACINHPERVASIHKEYIKAGANSIKTNSFGVNRLTFPDRETRKKIIESSYNIAKNTAEGKGVNVFADIGYIDDSETEKDYLESAEIFVSLGAENYLFETLGEFRPIIPAIKYIRENVKNSVVIVSFAVDQSGWTRKGFYYEDLIGSALEYADYSGLNCLNGPHHICRLIKEISDIKTLAPKIIAMPNTSGPSVEKGRFFVYPDNKEYYGDRLFELYNMGLGAVGGCCGSTPEHIKIFTEKIKDNDQKSSHIPILENETKDVTKSVKNNGSKKSLLENMLDAGEKIILCELDSPLDTDIDFMMTGAKKLKDAGCHIITIADSPLARARADSFICGAKIKRELGIEVLPHLSCRDRNHIAIKGALLGANIENINNILAVTGDPLSDSDRKLSFNSFTLIDYINNLNSQVFNQNPFFVCGALNIHSPNFSVELKRAGKKEEKGCRCFLTQPIYTDEDIEKLKTAKETLDSYVLGGVMPIVSYKNATFLNNEVFGINIPENIIERFKDKDRETSEQIGLETAKEICEKIRNICDGFYIMVPLRRVDMTCELVRKL